MQDTPPSEVDPSGETAHTADDNPPAPARRLMAAHPIVVAAMLAAIAAAAARALERPAPPGQTAPAAPLPSYEVPCPAGSIADFARSAPPSSSANAPRKPVCVPIPIAREESAEPALADALPLRADRAEDFEHYQLPIVGSPARPDSLNGGVPSSADAVRFSAGPESEVHFIELDGQEGPSKIVFAGERNGPTVITVHEVRRERGSVTVFLVFSGFASLSPEWLAATPEQPVVIEAGTLIGNLGTEGLLLGARQLRRDARTNDSVPKLATETTIATDVRNVLKAR